MYPKEYYLNSTYHILVRETNDGHVSEWFGSLTLSTQEGGEVYIDLSFDDQPIEYVTSEQGEGLEPSSLAFESPDQTSFKAK